LMTKETTKESLNPTPAPNAYREKRSLQNRLKKLEQIIEEKNQQAAKLEIELAKSELYEVAAQATLKSMLIERDALQQELQVAEESWLEVLEALEGFDD